MKSFPQSVENSKVKSSHKLLCVFAHPDDEAFGPAGTICKFASEGDVYIICTTDGANGNKVRGDLAKTREGELLKSAEILGVKKVYFLKFEDGTLCNKNYHKLASKIEEIAKRLKPETLLTFEPRGVSGHIDHMATSMVTTFVFNKLKFAKKLLYYVISKEARKLVGKNYFIYFPPGYSTNEIDLTIDIKKYWELKTRAIFCHKSQIKDAKEVEKIQAKLPKKEYFLILKK